MTLAAARCLCGDASWLKHLLSRQSAPGLSSWGYVSLPLSARPSEPDSLYLSQLTLQNFRCYPQLELHLPAGLNVFVGPNAAGKTSLLEAVVVLATTKSPRTTQDRQLVMRDAAWAAIRGEFRRADNTQMSISVMLQGATAAADAHTPPLPSVLTTPKRVEVNGVLCDSVQQVVGQAPAVLFSPDDLQLVKGPPAVRRRFLNTAISQLMPRYLDDLLRYRRALRQRNELLKQMQAGQAAGRDLAPWTTQLVEAGAQISADREQFTGVLSQRISDIHSRLSGQTEQLILRYQGVLAGIADPPEKVTAFREQLESDHLQELARGATQSGPHRDDLVIELDGWSLRQLGSQGQQRTAAVSLKLSEAHVMQHQRGEAPILLLDDCLSELDPHRASQVLEFAQQFEQVLITSAGTSAVLRESGYNTWHEVAGGCISSQ